MDKKRIKIGIIYSLNPDWIAGAYYVQNLITSLNTLNKTQQPIVHLICNSRSTYKTIKGITNYPKLKYSSDHYNKNTVFLRRIINKLLGSQFDTIKKYDSGIKNIKFVYPITNGYMSTLFKDYTKSIAWIPDFQEEYLPYLFSEDEIIARRNTCNYYIENKIPIIFSSKDAQNDFIKFYPKANNTRSYILPFAVFHPDFSNQNIESIKRKYAITKPYLFCANQFWKHKNHLFLFEAFHKAKQNGLNIQLVCSGKLYDYRDDAYKDKILKYIIDHNLQNDIILTGFINRDEQLCLMKYSYAVVQPSLFEGWSTVVEDAKRLNKFIFLSDLRVHKEQAPLNSCYFDPKDTNKLSNKLLNVKPTNYPFNYSECVKLSAEAFYQIIKSI